MMGTTHKVGGLLASTAMAKAFFTEDILATGLSIASLQFGSILGSLLNDIDKKESTIGRELWFISWPIYFFRLITKLLIKLFGLKILRPIGGRKIKKVLQKIYCMLGHRFLTHSIITWLVFSIALFVGLKVVYPNTPEILLVMLLPFLVGVSIGILSHIALDFLTDEKEAIFSPITEKKYGLGIIRTGGFLESVLRVIMIVVTIVVGFDTVKTYLLR